MSTKREHITEAQKLRLVAIIEGNPKLKTGKFEAGFSMKDATLLWQKIAVELNRSPVRPKNGKSGVRLGRT